jgi:hypothetical protein
MSDSLRRTAHKGTTKIEGHHKFAKHLAFGPDPQGDDPSPIKLSPLGIISRQVSH